MSTTRRAVFAVLAAAALILPTAAAAADNRVWSPTGTVYERGGQATFVARAFAPGSTVTFTVFLRAPIDLGVGEADEDGRAQTTVNLPRRMTSGLYIVRASGVGSEGVQHLDLAIRVRPAAGPPRWKVTSDQVGPYLLAMSAVGAALVAGVVRRRRRRDAARRYAD